MEKKRKYRILEMLKKLPLEDSQIARNKLPIALGVSKDTFNKWLYLNAGAKHQIPSNHLATLANYFKCPITELFNEDIPTINHADLKELEAEKSKSKFNLDA